MAIENLNELISLSRRLNLRSQYIDSLNNTVMGEYVNTIETDAEGHMISCELKKGSAQKSSADFLPGSMLWTDSPNGPTADEKARFEIATEVHKMVVDKLRAIKHQSDHTLRGP